MLVSPPDPTELAGALDRLMRRGDQDSKQGMAIAVYSAKGGVGTTSVAAYLCDLATGEVINHDSMMNPQVIYGEDVMSRIRGGHNYIQIRVSDRGVGTTTGRSGSFEVERRSSTRSRFDSACSGT